MLRLLQPTTKALAQLLAGNARPSGQLRHARNVLDQAEYLVEERQVEQLPPREREEFLEQYARLKLTVTDARDGDHGHGERLDGGQRADRPAVAPERLLEMALALSSSPAQRQSVAQASQAAEAGDDLAPGDLPADDPPATVDEAEPADLEDKSGPRGQRLRLKRTQSIAAAG